MKQLTYILRSLWFYRKKHLALFAGTVLSTAVLTGALVVGDSVKYSLKHLVDVRLGKTSHALETFDRFFRAELAEDLQSNLGTPVISMLTVTGIGVNPEADQRANRVQVIGVDDSFPVFFEKDISPMNEGEAWVNEKLAQKLGLKMGDEWILRVQNVSVIPLNAPFSKESNPTISIRLTVKDILGDDRMGRFSLKSDQKAPDNVFIHRETLAGLLDIPGRANTLLVSGIQNFQVYTDTLQKSLKAAWKLKDLGLHLKELKNSGKIELTSDRIFLDPPVTEVLYAREKTIEPILTYLVNSIENRGRSTPYSFVSAVHYPYIPKSTGAEEAVITDWLAEDLKAKKGDTVEITYFVVGPLRKLEEKSHPFRVGEIINIVDGLVDSTLMPPYPGLAGTSSCSEWDADIPIDFNRIRDKDEFYWEDYKGTPKALIPLETGKKLWENEFGWLTAIRFNQKDFSQESVEQTILNKVDPASLQLVFRPVYEEGQQAAANAVDFGELFLSLSFFVMAAGILLIILLHNLQLESRARETGVLTALGFRRNLLLRLKIMESFVVIISGGLIGVAFGVLYNIGLMAGLNSVWNDAVHADRLNVYVVPETLFVGGIMGILVALLTLIIVSYRKLKHPVVGLIQNLRIAKSRPTKIQRFVSYVFMVVAGLGAAALLLYSYSGSNGMNASLFLAAGGLFLMGCVAGFNTWLNGQSEKAIAGVSSLLALAWKNTKRNRARSLTIVLLFSLGTFTVVITGANRKTFYGTETERSSGTGGFAFWAETSLPVNRDLKTEDGKKAFGLNQYGEATQSEFVQLLTLSGNDASCLNLNQVQQPRILGVDPDELRSRNAFSFAKLAEGVNTEDPWSELDKIYAPNVYPAFADQTVITWSLKKTIGDTLYYNDEDGNRIALVLAGGFTNSIFQGNIIIADSHFRRFFPSVSGSQVMLVDYSGSSEMQFQQDMEQQLADFGIEVERTTVRLARFNSVTNTYLNVFMVLGGLGVLIGTIGLGIVIWRTTLERKEELALLVALGFRNKSLMILVFAENLFLMLMGLIIGISSAVVGILPSLLSPAFAIPGMFIFWILLIILLSSLIWIWIPAQRLARLTLVEALRKE